MMATRKIGSALYLLRVLFCAGQMVARGQGPAAQVPANATSGREYLHEAAQRELLYVALPGSLERPVDNNGNGIIVLDVKNNYNFEREFRPGMFQQARTHFRSRVWQPALLLN